jgi:hypothetical protein
MLDKLAPPAEETARETSGTRMPQPGLWFTAGAFSQARIYSRYIALQIDAIEQGRLAKRIETRD